MAVALVFAMKLRDPNIYLDDESEEFMATIQPPITKENYSDILRRSERTNSEIPDSSQSDDDENDAENSDNDETILATLSDETDNEEDDNDDEDDIELDSTARGKGRQRKKIWRNCYGESRLHLACKEKNGLKKVKQFVAEGVCDLIQCKINHFHFFSLG